MKRLVDETTDELARSLLQAGIEHRPPPGNKAQLIVALGAGGALSMLSSNAFAWLSTTAGKVTAVGVAVGVAGAVWVAAPPSGEARSSGSVSNRSVSNRSVSSAAAASTSDSTATTAAELRASDATTAPGERGVDSADRATASAASPGVEAPGSARTTRGIDAAPLDAAAADAVADNERQPRSWRGERGARKLAGRKGLAKQKVVASKQSELRRDGPLSAVVTPPAGGAFDGASTERDALDAEVRLVDEMHSAARRNDRDALGRSLDHYRAAFPDGQLKREVAEFAARLEQPGTSGAR